MSPDKNSTEQLLEDREKVHGDWKFNAAVQHRLKEEIAYALRCRDGKLLPYQVQALEMICVKMARIIAGDPYHPDHWDDIAGYAMLGKGK